MSGECINYRLLAERWLSTKNDPISSASRKNMAQVLDLRVYQLANTVSNSVHVCNAGLIEQNLGGCTVSLVDEPFKKIHAFDSG